MNYTSRMFSVSDLHRPNDYRALAAVRRNRERASRARPSSLFLIFSLSFRISFPPSLSDSSSGPPAKKGGTRRCTTLESAGASSRHGDARARRYVRPIRSLAEVEINYQRSEGARARSRPPGSKLIRSHVRGGVRDAFIAPLVPSGSQEISSGRVKKRGGNIFCLSLLSRK